jgi:hypothetical protein
MKIRCDRCRTEFSDQAALTRTLPTSVRLQAGGGVKIRVTGFLSKYPNANRLSPRTESIPKFIVPNSVFLYILGRLDIRPGSWDISWNLRFAF